MVDGGGDGGTGMSETSHARANRITVDAFLIARRDGRTAEERARIYEREIARLNAETVTTQTVEHISPAIKIWPG